MNIRRTVGGLFPVEVVFWEVVLGIIGGNFEFQMNSGDYENTLKQLEQPFVFVELFCCGRMGGGGVKQRAYFRF